MICFPFKKVELIVLTSIIASIPLAAFAGNKGIEEIVVTANKREQNLNDVGLTVQVISGDDFQNQQINTLDDIAKTIPGLSFSNTPNNLPVYTLRGVGFYESSLGAYPTVSLYMDQVPMPFPALTQNAAYDLERVEVLKGPQGTLFGQNATGGAINYIAAKPTDELSAGAFFSYGRFDEVIGEGFVSGSLLDTVKGRFSGRYEGADGWQSSNSRSDANGETDKYMGRLQLEFDPSESTHFLLNINGWKDKSETPATQFLGVLPQQAVLAPDFVSSSFSPLKPRAADWTPGLPFSDNSMWQASLRADIELSENLVLTTITSYVDYEQNVSVEGEGLPIQVLDILSDSGTIESLSQEIRLANAGDGKIRWVVGVNYEQSEVDQSVNLDFSDTSASATFGFIGYPISHSTYTASQEMTNYAFFGNIEYDLSDALTLKGGVRYTNAENDYETCYVDASGNPGGAGPLFFDILLGGAFGAYTADKCFPINDLPYAVGNVVPGSPGSFSDSLEEDNVSWRFGVDWRLEQGALVYANLSKGYKAGSFPTVSASTHSQYLPVVQESVLAYEVGFKSEFLDKTAQLNGALFYYDYEDKQMRAKQDAGVFGVLDVLQNIPKSTIKGFELELLLQPLESLTVSAAYTYLDAEVDEFEGINASGINADFGGSKIPFTPESEFRLAMDYDFSISDSLDGFLGATASYRSDTFTVIGGESNPPNLVASAIDSGDPLFEIEGYTLVDMRAGIKTTDGAWRISVWGKNIFDKYSWNNTATAYDAVVRYPNKPATYGVSVKYRY